MDAETILILTSVGMGGLVGVVYGAYNYFTKSNPGIFEGKRFTASVLFGLIIGLVGGYTAMDTSGTLTQAEWWAMIGAIFLTYSGMQLYVNRFVDWLWVKLYSHKFLGV